MEDNKTNLKLEKKDLKDKKLSYEELNNIAHQLSEQSRNLYLELQKANQYNLFKRLDYLFKVIENSSIFDTEFVTKCKDEIKSIITIPETSDTNEQ